MHQCDLAYRKTAASVTSDTAIARTPNVCSIERSGLTCVDRNVISYSFVRINNVPDHGNVPTECRNEVGMVR
jgi:hypothetical protein